MRAAACLALAGFAVAQDTLADDTAILLAFKALPDNAQNGELSSWAQGGNPCGTGFDDKDQGWEHVMCCASYAAAYPYGCTGANTRRVTYLYLSSTGVTGDVAPLAALTQLTGLHLSYTGVTGDVAPLAALTQLTGLYLDGTGVTGDVAPLAALTQLTVMSLHNTGVTGDVAPLAALTQLTGLHLSYTGVYGDAAVLRAIPGLGDGWSSSYFDACSDFASSCPAGTSSIAQADSFIGRDECACCSGSHKVRVPSTGACSDGECPVLFPSVFQQRSSYWFGRCHADPCAGVDCGEHGSCSGGACVCESGAYSGSWCQAFGEFRSVPANFSRPAMKFCFLI